MFTIHSGKFYSVTWRPWDPLDEQRIPVSEDHLLALSGLQSLCILHLAFCLLFLISVGGWKGSRRVLIPTKQTCHASHSVYIADAKLLMGASTCLRLHCTQELSVRAVQLSGRVSRFAIQKLG